MLQHLTIENYALIQSLSIPFHNGFTVITGETGAGKSIILGALHLILGQRADVQTLFDSEKKCIVEGTFLLKGLDLALFFEENDLDYQEVSIIRREITPNGKSRAFINDTPTSLHILKELGSKLIDIHSQHQTLTLNNATFQLQLLDLLSNQPQTLTAYHHTYHHYIQLKLKWEKLKEEDVQNKADQDYTQFLFDELHQAQLKEGEQEELEERLTLMNHAESIKQTLSLGNDVLIEGEFAVYNQLNTLKGAISKLITIRSDFEELRKRIDTNLIELKDIASELTALDAITHFSAEEQDEAALRLDHIYRLQTKHHVQSIQELIQIQTQLDHKLHSISNTGDQLDILEKEVSEAKSKLRLLADQISMNRREASTILEQQITPILQQVSLKDAELRIKIAALPELHKTGGDQVCFLFKANRGGEFREIEKVASGGELSRLMLAIKSLLTKNTVLPTIIFDEIDSGVSGGIAAQVGHIMLSMSTHMQVIAITHLPQIAAKASQQYKVYKSIENDRTISIIKPLLSSERIREIASMLSSGNITESTLQTAKELMQS